MKNNIYGQGSKKNYKKTNYSKKYLLDENSQIRKHHGIFLNNCQTASWLQYDRWNESEYTLRKTVLYTRILSVKKPPRMMQTIFLFYCRHVV